MSSSSPAFPDEPDASMNFIIPKKSQITPPSNNDDDQEMDLLAEDLKQSTFAVPEYFTHPPAKDTHLYRRYDYNDLRALFEGDSDAEDAEEVHDHVSSSSSDTESSSSSSSSSSGSDDESSSDENESDDETLQPIDPQGFRIPFHEDMVARMPQDQTPDSPAWFAKEKELFKILFKPPRHSRIVARAQKGDYECLKDLDSSIIVKDGSVTHHGISKNEWLCPKKRISKQANRENGIDDHDTCRCNPDNGDNCGPSCFNRTVSTECIKCPCGDSCQNRRLQDKNYIQYEIKNAHDKGQGIFAKTDVDPGALVLEYVGQVITDEERYRRNELYNRLGVKHFYFLALDPGVTIDATQRGNDARFINHSCDPNADVSKWTVGPDLRIAIIANRPIKAGEEITFDYDFERIGKAKQACHCGAAKCRGFIGPKSGEKVDLATKLANQALAVQKNKEKREKKEAIEYDEDKMLDFLKLGEEFVVDKEHEREINTSKIRSAAGIAICKTQNDSRGQGRGQQRHEALVAVKKEEEELIIHKAEDKQEEHVQQKHEPQYVCEVEEHAEVEMTVLLDSEEKSAEEEEEEEMDDQDESMDHADMYYSLLDKMKKTTYPLLGRHTSHKPFLAFAATPVILKRNLIAGMAKRRIDIFSIAVGVKAIKEEEEKLDDFGLTKREREEQQRLLTELMTKKQASTPAPVGSSLGKSSSRTKTSDLQEEEGEHGREVQSEDEEEGEQEEEQKVQEKPPSGKKPTVKQEEDSGSAKKKRGRKSKSEEESANEEEEHEKAIAQDQSPKKRGRASIENDSRRKSTSCSEDDEEEYQILRTGSELQSKHSTSSKQKSKATAASSIPNSSRFSPSASPHSSPSKSNRSSQASATSSSSSSASSAAPAASPSSKKINENVLLIEQFCLERNMSRSDLASFAQGTSDASLARFIRLLQQHQKQQELKDQLKEQKRQESIEEEHQLASSSSSR